MLDTDTKRRIDTCRDILVGKVPDPKSQVEQITIALIYKFMDDMDAEAEELGGKRTFFAGEYEQFGWSKLMAPNMGGFDVLALYSEAIQKMNENPGIPALFRDIFKNAYLPYRDPETLRIFLKEIDGFTYDHSEKLGDAFEYLLSVLGSQGDAGQFRTPRHIIDFMVEIIDPKKGESILDPACGTAGFLISAWKHILKSNTKARSGDLLTPDERKYLAANIFGYDISPDMVRLSLVNMYLHGFSDPHIVEYDTLTSEEKWNEYADVILANPPFMSPKGGIKPHKRFSVQATRSEVLFVDYMAEHLTPNGRAAIIVPEGIIFQSQTAYKQLRKMLVDTSLVAVVSLPSGVFQPYSGVKTSILVMDKSLAKRCDSVLFVKVENDGFGLGAQRRVVTGSDLPEAAEAVKEFLNHAKHQKDSDSVRIFSDFRGYQIVKKEKIAANGEYNLSGERYREGSVSLSQFPHVTLGEICEVKGGKRLPQGEPYAAEKTIHPYLRVTDFRNATVDTSNLKYITEEIHKEISRYTISAADVYITIAGTIGLMGTIPEQLEGANLTENAAKLVVGSQRIDNRYLALIGNSTFVQEQIASLTHAVGVPKLSLERIKTIQIPLPPLEVQQEVVTEIEGYQKIIDGARAVLDNYRPYIPIDPDWPMRPISEVSIKITKGSSPTWQGISYTTQDEGVLFVTSENVGLGQLLLEKPKYVERRFNEIEPKSILQKGDVLTNIVGASIGRTAIFNLDLTANVNQAVCVIRPNTTLVDSIYLMTFLNSPAFIQRLLGNSVENARANVSMGILGSLTIPLPPLPTQHTIVAEIEAEQALVNANRELITRFEKKIQAALARVWGEDAV